MKASMFAKFDGLPGDSEDGKHKEWIDLLSWSWGVSQSANTHLAKGGGRAQASVGDLSLVKHVDKATPDLMKACLTGKHFPWVKLACTKAGGDENFDFVKIQMDDVVISSVSTGGHGGEDSMTESVSLNFAKVSYTYAEQAADGSEGAKGEAKFDIRAGETF